MSAELPSEATLEKIQGFLGETFLVSHLHPIHVRFRRVYALTENRLPSSLLLTSASGRVFKLHASSTSERIDHMVRRSSQAEHLNIFPKCIWQDEQAILLEYISGSQPDFSSIDFARDYGKCMARIHSVAQSPSDLSRIAGGIERDLKCLESSGLLRKNVSHYTAILEEETPEGLLNSLDYTDNKPGNFIRDHQGNLKFIDLGALRANRPAGQYMCGSLFVRRLNREEFATSYLQAGGLSQVIDNAKYLRMLHCVWSAALYLRKMKAVPVYLPFHKLSYRILAIYLVAEFHKLLDNNEHHLCAI